MTIDEAARIAAARAVLITHDELLRVEAIGDNFELGPDDLPVDGYGWLAWHAEQYKPAAAAWKTAMGQLRAVLGGDEFPGTHPHNFRPACRRILARAGVPLHETDTDRWCAVTARLLVSGSRRHTDTELIRAVLVCAGRRLGRDTVLVHGAAPGVDTLAAGIWESWGLSVEAHPADWGRCAPGCPPLHRKVRRDGGTWCPTAGSRRNQLMVDTGADLMLALPLGPSAGTRDCARRAKAAGIPTVLITGPDDLDQVAGLLLATPTTTERPRPLRLPELATSGGTR